MKRCGTTLLEITISVSLSGMVLSAAATMLVAMWKADRRFQADFSQWQSLARLDIALRNDVHEARAAEIVEGGRLKLSLAGDMVVEYSAEEHHVTRLKKSGERVTHRETFALAKGSKIAMAVDASGVAAMVRLSVETDPANNFRAAIVEAALRAGRSGGATMEKVP